MQKKAVVGQSTLLPSLFLGGTNGKKIKIQRIGKRGMSKEERRRRRKRYERETLDVLGSVG
jgi:hypothetical protein